MVSISFTCFSGHSHVAGMCFHVISRTSFSRVSVQIALCPTRNSSSCNLGRQHTNQGSQNSVLWSWCCSFCEGERILVEIFLLDTCTTHFWQVELEKAVSKTRGRIGFGSFYQSSRLPDQPFIVCSRWWLNFVLSFGVITLNSSSTRASIHLTTLLT